MPYPTLAPTGTTRVAKPKAPRARRPASLKGASVGLLVNTKQNAAPFLDELGRLLIQRYGATSIMARTKVNFAQPAPDELIKEMAASCDVIITGIGDCGSRRPPPPAPPTPPPPPHPPTPPPPHPPSHTP